MWCVASRRARTRRVAMMIATSASKTTSTTRTAFQLDGQGDDSVSQISASVAVQMTSVRYG